MTMNTFIKEITSVLDSCSNVEILYQNINHMYKQIAGAQPWLESFTVRIDKTVDNRDFWYNCVESQSEDCVVISLGKKYSYIFREFSGWNLDDDLMENKKIAAYLMSSECLSIPLKVVDVKKMILTGYWKFDANLVPKLTSETPKDIRELISWDKKCVLTATNKDNMCVISRKEWDKTISNENKFI